MSLERFSNSSEVSKQKYAQDIFELPKYDLLQVGKKEKSRFLLDF
jgi:hypothetical protein